MLEPIRLIGARNGGLGVVDFTKRIRQGKAGKTTDPLEIYDALDRASDKGPLRPAQIAVLDEWHSKRRTERDVILKLHTGQGKTLIGLLMCQSQLNDGKERALYLCPNNMLVEQTCDQAKQFGIKVVQADPDLPDAFLDSKATLVTSVQKLFNGLTKFRLKPKSMPVSTVVMDDSHACVDALRASFVVTLDNKHPAYVALLDLFARDLELQAQGTFLEIRQNAFDVLMSVPYWAWRERVSQVTAIIAQHRNTDGVKFVWPLLKDTLEHCQCIVSGHSLQIVPFLPPLDAFGTYADAEHRVFMSATVTDDSFLVRGLGLTDTTITHPLLYKDEKWSGEKMILVPSLIDDSLGRDKIIKTYGLNRTGKAARYGVVALTPSFKVAEHWSRHGALVPKTETIANVIDNLRTGINRERMVAFANRYDGIDLPDDACRVLILDSTPRPESLLDRYDEHVRQDSEAIAVKRARTIEQGLGRSVRGERDYSVILIVGGDLVRELRGQDTRQHFSDQTRTQIAIGLETAELAKQEVESQSKDAAEVLREITQQCLNRDEGWKEFYAQEMNKMARSKVRRKLLAVFSEESKAERLAIEGNVDEAVEVLQALIDKYVTSNVDRGWYLQEMARYRFADSAAESDKLQRHAHKLNHKLLKPRDGIIVPTITVSQKRMAKIAQFLKRFDTYDDLNVAIPGITDNLRFGVDAKTFERALDELGVALGFETQRPDDDWGEGPDNLWAIRDGQYILWECKSEVLAKREALSKRETGQMANASAWFERKYPGASVKRIIVIPTNVLGKGAGFTEPVEMMTAPGLKALVTATHAFFREFRKINLKDVEESAIQRLIDRHRLGEEHFLSTMYTKKPKQP